MASAWQKKKKAGQQDAENHRVQSSINIAIDTNQLTKSKIKCQVNSCFFKTENNRNVSVFHLYQQKSVFA
jgi:hypothetical protein